jgi:chromosome segregation ATPase
MSEDLSRTTTDHQNAQSTINKLESVNSTLDAGLFDAKSKIEDLDRLLQSTISREKDLQAETQTQRSQISDFSTSLSTLSLSLAKYKSTSKDQKRDLSSSHTLTITLTTDKLEQQNTINHQSVQIESQKKDISISQAQALSLTSENKDLKSCSESLKSINQSLINENTTLQYEVRIGNIACESEKRTNLHLQKSLDNALLEVSGVKEQLDAERARRETAEGVGRDLKEEFKTLGGEVVTAGVREKGLRERCSELGEKNGELEESLGVEIANGARMGGLMEKNNENIRRLNKLGESKEQIISGMFSPVFCQGLTVIRSSGYQ